MKKRITKRTKIKFSSLSIVLGLAICLLLFLVGNRLYVSHYTKLTSSQSSNQQDTSIQPAHYTWSTERGITPSPRDTASTVSDVRSLIVGDLSSEPDQWKNASLTGEQMAPDLIQVCVDIPSTTSTCDYFEYWTNKTGKWTLLARDESGQEGSNFCEYFEKWQVAKGMECRSWNKKESKWETRTVMF